MCGRSRSLTVLLLALLAVTISARAAHAHRLDAQAFLLPDHQVQIQSWFDNGNVPRGATVQVFHANGQLLAEGRLDEKGHFLFAFAVAEPLRVVVAAGGGHRKELTLSAADLEQATGADAKTPDASTTGQTTSNPVPLPDRSPAAAIRDTVKDVLIGVGFLLALAAFFLSLRNARQLGSLRRKPQMNTDEHG
jgi:nickel transport protein